MDFTNSEQKYSILKNGNEVVRQSADKNFYLELGRVSRKATAIAKQQQQDPKLSYFKSDIITCHVTVGHNHHVTD